MSGGEAGTLLPRRAGERRVNGLWNWVFASRLRHCVIQEEMLLFFSIHEADVGTKQAELLHSCRRSRAQKRSLPVPPTTALVGASHTILKHTCRATHTIVPKRSQQDSRRTCLSAAVVVELEARTNQTRPL